MEDIAASRSHQEPIPGIPPLRLSIRVPWWILGLAALCALLHGFAAGIRALAADPGWREWIIRNGWELYRETNRHWAEAGLMLAGLAFAIRSSRIRLAIGGVFKRLAARRREALVAAALTPVALRLALFPVVGVPAPKIADEFGYLLLADTFAAGRLVNPPHPMWQHFETLYVLQQPVQASIYPFASGLVMAAGKALGAHPWFGVLAGLGLMSGAICWMLQGWMPPRWALLGALIAGVRVGVDTYWANGYWGGAIAAFGGALVLGAVPRLLRRPEVSATFALIAGSAVLVQSRPFEGFLLFVTVSAALAFAHLRKGPRWRKQFWKRPAPLLAAGGVLVLAGSAYYNWRVTGNPLLLPYLLHQQVYGTPQNLRFGSEVATAPRTNIHRDIRDNFEWQRDAYRSQIAWSSLVSRLGIKLAYLWSFFLGPALAVALIAFGIWDIRIRFLTLTLLFVVIGAGTLYGFFFPHYIAPVYACMPALAMRGLQRIRVMRWRGRPAGRVWARWLTVSTLVSSAAGILGWTSLVAATTMETTPRTRVEDELLRRGGSHLVLVRYGERHDFHKSWIYNGAHIDESPIVWARDLGKEKNLSILQYYADREVWLAEPDDNLLTPYLDQDRPRVIAVLNAAGRSNYFTEGLAPGSVVTITGRNLTANGSISLALAWSGDALQLSAPFSRSSFQLLPDPGVRVRFDGRDAAVLAASENRLAVVAPLHLPARTTELSIEVNGWKRTVRIPVLRANPGIFEMRHPAGRIGAVLHSDGSPVTYRKPARRKEEVQMIVTGLGPDPVRGVVVGVNHRGARHLWTRRNSPATGFDLIAFEVPEDAPPGSRIPLSMGVDGASGRVYSNNSTLAIE